METILFDSVSVPQMYLLCYVDGCPLKDTCMRHWTCEQLDGNVASHPCVLPTAISGGSDCRYYRQKQVVRGAWGFNRLFAEVKRKDDGRIRAEIKAYLGGNGTYYLYHNGKRLLSQEQQNHIVGIFRRYGYTEGLEFDGYRMEYLF